MSINQYTMNNLLGNQKIRKRRYFTQAVSAEFLDSPRRNSSERSRNRNRRSKLKPAFRPAGIISIFKQNVRLIDKIKQEPVRVNHRKPVVSAKISGSTAPKNPLGPRNTQKQAEFIDGKRNAFPVIPFAALFMLILGAFFIIHSQGGSMDWIDREVINSGKDSGSQYNLALYAGLNPAVSQENDLLEAPADIIPIDLSETFSWQTYKVKKGDSVSKIAAAFSVSMDAIISSNSITNARTLREGEVLRIPNMDGIPYTVKSGDSLSKISKSMGVPLEAILDANDIQSDIINAGMTLFIPGARMNRNDLKLALGELFIYPIRGAKLSSTFGWRDDPFGSGARLHHAAIDLSAPRGTPIWAAMEGEVLTIIRLDRLYGNFIILGHPGGISTMYAHLDTFSVKKGDKVVQGAKIGTVGDTGQSTGPHLHFAVFKNNRAVNPLDYLNPQR